MAAEVAKCVFSIDAKQAIDTINVFGSRLDGIGNLANAAKAAIGGIFSGGILAGAKYFVDQASDAQETTSKFGVVFQSVSKQADAAVRKLVNTYNMSTHAARTALSDTGDLLSGFGLTGAAALDLAEKVNQLGSDLASFTNYEGGSKGAAEALTKALLGEREQAKMLGIAILEEQVQAQILADKKQGITYASQQEAKAYATLKIAQRQSVNAIGDAERSITSYAYNTNKLSNNLDDLKRNIGAALIEPATKIAKGLATCVDWVNNLNPALLKWGTILTVTGGFIGGAVVGITGLIGTIRTYMGIQRLASVATGNSTQQTSVNTVATGTNSQSVATSTVSRNSSTVAVEAHTAALIRNTQASNANSISNSAKRNGISLTKTPKSSISLTKAPKTGISLAKAAPLPGKGVLGIGKSISGVFGKLPSLIMKPLSLITGIFGKSKLLTTIHSFGARFAGFAVPFVGWGSAIVTGISVVASVFKRMPEWFEIFLQDFWPKIKSGGLYVMGKVADFLSPGNLWGLIKSGISGFGNLLKDGWNGAVDVVKRMSGLETDSQKAYMEKQISKSREEAKNRANEIAKAERELAEARVQATKSFAKSLAEFNKGLLVKFDTGNTSKQEARKKEITDAEKKYKSVITDRKKQGDDLTKQYNSTNSEKTRMQKSLDKLEEEIKNTKVGDGKLEVLNARRQSLAKTIAAWDQKLIAINNDRKKLQVDPGKLSEKYQNFIEKKSEDAIETAKENREEKNTKDNLAYERSIFGKTGTEKTSALKTRLENLTTDLASDREQLKKQEIARSKLDQLKNDTNPEIQRLASLGISGDQNALDQLSNQYGDVFKDLGAMLTDSDILEKEKAVQSAKDELRDQQASERALTYKKQETADQKRLNLSGGKLQDAENVYGDIKEKALGMNTGEIKTATAKYVTALNQAHNEEDLAIIHKIANINKEMEATTDAEKLADLEAEKMGLENDLQNSQREHNKKIKDTYKERDEIERERAERQKALKQNIQKSLDESLLKEAKTGRQRLSIYGGQYMRAMHEYRTAKNTEKKFEALGKVKEASDSINGEIEAMAKKQEERNKNVWTTAAPQKAVTAGSTEAYSIQNKLYNSFQRNVERNTKDMVGLNKRMIAELQTLNSQQQSEYTLDVKV